jgi:hypothetical protein
MTMAKTQTTKKSQISYKSMIGSKNLGDFIEEKEEE